MVTAASLVAPYASVMVIFRWRRIAARIASHTALTLPVGWAAVIALLAALLGVWSPPTGVLVLCAALSGLAMITPGDSGGDDGPGDEDDDGQPPALDWTPWTARGADGSGSAGRGRCGPAAASGVDLYG